MRGSDTRSGELFSYVDLEARVPAKHPLRKIRQLVNDVLASLDDEFARLYSPFGRESIPPERLLRALLLQAFFSIRSERQLMEQLDYNLLFRWFVGLGIDDEVWVPTVFTKNRDRLLDADVAAKFMSALLAHAQVRGLLSDEHFSVDGTLIEAWASMKSFQPKAPPTEPGAPDEDPPDKETSDRNDTTNKAEPRPPKPEDQPMKDRNVDVDFHGQKRSNATHASTTDPDARLYKKGKGKETHGTSKYQKDRGGPSWDKDHEKLPDVEKIMAIIERSPEDLDLYRKFLVAMAKDPAMKNLSMTEQMNIVEMNMLREKVMQWTLEADNAEKFEEMREANKMLRFIWQTTDKIMREARERAPIGGDLEGVSKAIADAEGEEDAEYEVVEVEEDGEE